MSDTFQVRLLLRCSLMGAVIGKAGATVSEIRSESNTKIHIQREPVDDHRVIDIIGDELSIVSAVNKIFAKIADGFGESQTIKVISTPNQIGKLIGKQGNQVKEFRDGSGANIKVFRAEELPQFAPDRCITVSGNHESVLNAVLLMIPVMAKNPPYGMRSMTQENRSGGQMAPILQMSPNMGQARPMGMPLMSPMDNMMMELDSPFDQGKRRLISEYGPRKRMCVEDEVCNVTVAAAIRMDPTQAGRMIGRGGANISEIRSTSGARVSVTDCEAEHSGLRDVEVEGNITQVCTALTLIKRSLLMGQQAAISKSSH